MTFELESDGLRFWCSSPFWTRKLLERGARLVDATQARYLSDAAAPTDPARVAPVESDASRA